MLETKMLQVVDDQPGRSRNGYGTNETRPPARNGDGRQPDERDVEDDEGIEGTAGDIEESREEKRVRTQRESVECSLKRRKMDNVAKGAKGSTARISGHTRRTGRSTAGNSATVPNTTHKIAQVIARSIGSHVTIRHVSATLFTA
jgi:hypothetical protein